ncbi:MAG: hypothetical protein OXF41_05185 [bacterium]|nr:hypothetical protein [bacterium]
MIVDERQQAYCSLELRGREPGVVSEPFQFPREGGGSVEVLPPTLKDIYRHLQIPLLCEAAAP